jgi:MFS family permease
MPFIMSIANAQVVLEYSPSYNRGAQMGLYVGLLVGALFWGISADIIGRKWAFNLTLFIASIFTLIGGAAPGYTAWSSFVAIAGFGFGGNLVLDTTVFLEYVPPKNQWLVTLMAIWWGIGQTVAGLFAWAHIREYLNRKSV